MYTNFKAFGIKKDPVVNRLGDDPLMFSTLPKLKSSRSMNQMMILGSAPDENIQHTIADS